MKFRKVRVAWSVLWGAAVVLLCVLWVRSYSYHGTLSRITNQRSYQVFGFVAANFYYTYLPAVEVAGDPNPAYPWTYRDHALSSFEQAVLSKRVQPLGLVFHVAIWEPTIATAIIAMLPWLFGDRFSLRMLFLATTLIAAALGLYVWLASSH